MKSYLEWKKQYKDQFPPSWDQWLMMVHACLDVLEEANGDEAEKYRNRYQQIIDEKAKDFYQQAEKLNISFVSCQSVDDLIALQQYITQKEHHIAEFQVLKDTAAEEDIILPAVWDINEEILSDLKEFLQIQRKEKQENIRRKKEYDLLVSKAQNEDIELIKPTQLTDEILAELDLDLRKKIKEKKHQEYLENEYQKLQSKAQAENIDISPPMFLTDEILAELYLELHAKIKEKKHQQRLKSEWDTLCDMAKENNLPLLELDFALTDEFLEQATIDFKKKYQRLNSIRALIQQGELYGLETQSPHTYYDDRVLEKFLSNQVEAREKKWKRLDEIENTYEIFNISKHFSKQDRIVLLDKNLEEVERIYQEDIEIIFRAITQNGVPISPKVLLLAYELGEHIESEEPIIQIMQRAKRFSSQPSFEHGLPFIEVLNDQNTTQVCSLLKQSTQLSLVINTILDYFLQHQNYQKLRQQPQKLELFFQEMVRLLKNPLVEWKKSHSFRALFFMLEHHDLSLAKQSQHRSDEIYSQIFASSPAWYFFYTPHVQDLDSISLEEKSVTFHCFCLLSKIFSRTKPRIQRLEMLEYVFESTNLPVVTEETITSLLQNHIEQIRNNSNLKRTFWKLIQKIDVSIQIQIYQALLGGNMKSLKNLVFQKKSKIHNFLNYPLLGMLFRITEPDEIQKIHSYWKNIANSSPEKDLKVGEAIFTVLFIRYVYDIQKNFLLFSPAHMIYLDLVMNGKYTSFLYSKDLWHIIRKASKKYPILKMLYSKEFFRSHKLDSFWSDQYCGTPMAIQFLRTSLSDFPKGFYRDWEQKYAPQNKKGLFPISSHHSWFFVTFRFIQTLSEQEQQEFFQDQKFNMFLEYRLEELLKCHHTKDTSIWISQHDLEQRCGKRKIATNLIKHWKKFDSKGGYDFSIMGTKIKRNIVYGTSLIFVFASLILIGMVSNKLVFDYDFDIHNTTFLALLLIFAIVILYSKLLPWLQIIGLTGYRVGIYSESAPKTRKDILLPEDVYNCIKKVQEHKPTHWF